MRLALVLLLVTMVGIVLAKKDLQQEWKNWKTQHGKHFKSPEEEEIGFKNFQQHDAEIDRQNELYAQGKSTWKAGHNSHSHLSHDDLKKRNGFKPRDKTRAKRSLTGPYVFGANFPVFYVYTANPATVNISCTSFNISQSEPVQDQGECGNCYSFAAGTVLAYLYQNSYSQSILVSRQDIVDCSTYLGNNGCNGGDPRLVFDYFILNKTSTESAYPFIYYTQSNDSSIPTESCQTQKRTGTLYGIDTTKYNMMQINPDELSYKNALEKCGPIAITIYAQSTVDTYQSGIFSCSTSGQNNHAVTLIGWGQDSNGNNYWIIKNSWGVSWGQSGYLSLAFGSCGITGSSYSLGAAICPISFS
jgi:cathepsin L